MKKPPQIKTIKWCESTKRRPLMMSFSFSGLTFPRGFLARIATPYAAYLLGDFTSPTIVLLTLLVLRLFPLHLSREWMYKTLFSHPSSVALSWVSCSSVLGLTPKLNTVSIPLSCMPLWIWLVNVLTVRLKKT